MVKAEGPLRLLVADATGLYWVELQTKEKKTQSRVMFLPINESRIVELARDTGIIRSVVLDKNNLYWLSDFNLVRYSKESSETGVLTELGDAQAFALIQDAKKLYWVSGGGDKIYSIPKTGGSPQVVARSESIAAIAIDGEDLYWASGGTEENDFKDGFIERAELGTSKQSKVIEKIGNPSSIKHHKGLIYWSTDGDIWYSNPTKPKPKKLALDEGTLSVFLVDEAFLYGANLSDKLLWKYSRAANEKTTLAPVDGLYDLALFEGRLFWTQNSKGAGGPLTAIGALSSLCL
jgi:hypothetical protein